MTVLHCLLLLACKRMLTAQTYGCNGVVRLSDWVQVMMGSKRPSPRHKSPDPVDMASSDAATKRVRVDKLEDQQS